MSYARIVANYPHVVLLVVLVVVGTCLIVSITSGITLNFNDPLAGFEPRQTDIANKLIAFDNLIHNAGNKISLVPYERLKTVTPLERIKNKTQKKNRGRKWRKKKVKKKSKINQKHNNENFFCGVPDKAYARLVFQSIDDSSLLNLNHIHNLCKIEHVWFTGETDYYQNCFKSKDKKCCRIWSLSNYVTLLSNKTSCFDVTSEDVQNIYKLLDECSNWFQNYTIGANCDNSTESWYYSTDKPMDNCQGVPQQCIKYNALYHILYFITDKSFLEKKNTNYFLKYTVMFLPLARSSVTLNLYNHLEKLPKEFDSIELVGIKFGIKQTLFQNYLVSDSFWLLIAATTVFVLMWLYCNSIFITIMTFLAMFWSLELAYFLYTFVFEIKFFPYMNMVTVIVMIGIGVDDVFIYCKVWLLAKSEKNTGTLEKIVTDTLKHAALSMLVTSLTTSAAFLSNYIINITAIQCFSIFAATAVMCNFLLMVTWVPASILVYEKWCNFSLCDFIHCHSLMKFHFLVEVYKLPSLFYNSIIHFSKYLFENLIPMLIMHYRYLWIILFSSLGMCGIVVIFYYPSLKLPTSKRFQIFSPGHLLERYDFELNEYFGFEERNNLENMPGLPINVVWGIHPIDDGNSLNPAEKGSVVFDNTFDLTTESAQEWLLKFCSRIRQSDFYSKSSGIRLTDCFLENFVEKYMKQPCHVFTTDNTPCCNITQFPFTRAVFSQCLARYIPALQKTPGVYYSWLSPGPRFTHGQISAFFIEFLSNEGYTHSYEKMEKFYTRLNQWVTVEMLKAPPEMRNGWVRSDFDFYDLQKTLATTTPLTLGVSLVVATIVAFLTTLNVLITIYAILSITCVISVTIAALVLLGWELNVLESVVITISIGMSIDYTLHYGVAYRLSPGIDRRTRVGHSVSRMCSCVSMAALTTFLSGSLMMPSTIMAYRKFGVFLMLIISVSWVYSTFYFESLLRTFGPQGGFGQFYWPSPKCTSVNRKRHIDKTVYSFTESTLSSTATYPSHIPADFHELEPLSQENENRAHSKICVHTNHSQPESNMKPED